MSKVRINDLAREMEVKSRQILDVLVELGLGEGKTHSSSIEEHEADKVRGQFQHGSRAAGHGSAASSRASQTITPKIDLSHVSKPGDVMKAILAKKQEQEAEARRSHGTAQQGGADCASENLPTRCSGGAGSSPTARLRDQSPAKSCLNPACTRDFQPAAPAIASKPPAGARCRQGSCWGAAAAPSRDGCSSTKCSGKAPTAAAPLRRRSPNRRHRTGAGSAKPTVVPKPAAPVAPAPSA